MIQKLRKTGVFLLILSVLLTSLLTLNANMPVEVSASSSSFPYNATYQYGFSSLADNQASANSMLLAEWEDWKKNYVTSSGAGGFKRVQRDAGSDFDTVSEGMGYGMILAVYFDDKALFDDFFSYVKLYFNRNGLMGWIIDKNGNIITSRGGRDAASDADEDIAIALIFAHNKWGTGRHNYKNEALTLINNLYDHCVEPNTYVFKPGDTWGGSSVTNPSYYAPAWYKVFAKFTGDDRWNKVADKCYEIVQNVKAYNAGTGLVPDWCKANGTKADSQGYDYSYDAARYPWRTAVDYSWFGDTRAKENCDLMTAFFKKQGATGIVDGYTIQGAKKGQYHNATFIGPIASGAMTGLDLDFAKQLYNRTVAVKDSGTYHYYGNSIRLMTLLHLTGNFPNLYASGGPVATPRPTPPPQQPGELNVDHFEGPFSWITYDGQGATVSAASAPRDGGGNAMEVTYSGSATGYWGVLKSMVGVDLVGAQRISFDIRGTNNEVRFMLVEAGTVTGEDGEQWAYTVRPGNQWTTIDIPISQLAKRPDWQPPTADGNNRLDLNKIVSIHFSGMNANAGSFMVDNIKLTGFPVTATPTPTPTQQPTQQPTPTPVPTTQPNILYGDINGDGRIDSTDYILIRRHILEITVISRGTANYTRADVNGDGVIDSTDVILLRRYLLEIIDRFPAQR